MIAKLRAGEPQRLVIGMGHGTCTCEGAAFEYAFNVEHELRAAGVRDLAEIVYLTNEYELGDFGVGGMVFAQSGFQTSSQTWTESLFRERGVRAILRAHVERVEPGKLFYETLDGTHESLDFDFAMLLPPFRGADLRGVRPPRAPTSPTELFAPSGFLKVDADYTPKPYDDWRAEDWPSTYQSPGYAQRLRRRHRVRSAAPDLPAPHQPQRHRHHARPPHAPACRRASWAARSPAASRDMIQNGATAPTHTALDGRHGRRLRRLGGHRPPARLRRRDDDVPGRARTTRTTPTAAAASPTPLARSGSPGTGSSTCCTTCSSTRPRRGRAGSSSRSSPPVHCVHRASPNKEYSVSEIDERIASAPLPTDKTLRRRSSLPVQAWRFARINLRMVRMIRRGHAPLSSQTREKTRTAS